MAIRWNRPCYKCLSHYCDLSCKEKPKQEQGEPVAVVAANYALHWIGSGPIAPIIEKHRIKVGDKLYTTPQQRKPLTDEQIDDAVDAWFKPDADGNFPNWRERMRAAIEAAHGIKE